MTAEQSRRAQCEYWIAAYTHKLQFPDHYTSDTLAYFEQQLERHRKELEEIDRGRT